MTADPATTGDPIADLASGVLPLPTRRSGPRVGLVLAGGGEVGIAWHAAVVEALALWSGWNANDAEYIVGTSAGSWVCALLRAGIAPRLLVPLATDEAVADPQEAAALFDDPIIVPRAPRPRPWPPASPLLLRHALHRRSGVRPGSVLSGLLPNGTLRLSDFAVSLDRMFGDHWPERPLWITAVDLDTGRRTVFGHQGAEPARVSEAVAASCSVPAYFAPTVIGGRRYIDGGAHSIANLDLVAGLHLDIVVVSSPLSAARPRLGRGVDARTRRYIHRQLLRESQLVRESGTPVVVVAPMPEDIAAMGAVVRSLERSRRAPVAHTARRTLREQLDHGVLGRELLALRRTAAHGG